MTGEPLGTRRVRVLFLGCGDLGTGAAHRLHRAGMCVAVVELARPLAVRRRAAFSEAARDGEVMVEGVTCRRVTLPELAPPGPRPGIVALVVGSIEAAIERFRPHAVVDARMAKRVLPPRLGPGCFRVALGPGHVVGDDCDAVVETQRGPTLGAVLWQGAAIPDSAVPGDVGGQTVARVLRAPASGLLRLLVEPGARVRAGESVAEVAGALVRAPIDGMVRGLLADGDQVDAGEKLGDLDPRPEPPPLDRISDKAVTVGEGVLTAIVAGLSMGPGSAPAG